MQFNKLMKIAAHPGHYFQPLSEKPGKAIVVERRQLMPEVTAWFYVCGHRNLDAQKLHTHLSNKKPAYHPCYKCHARHRMMINAGEDDMDVEPKRPEPVVVKKRRYAFADPFEPKSKPKTELVDIPDEESLEKIRQFANVILPEGETLLDNSKKLKKLERMYAEMGELGEEFIQYHLNIDYELKLNKPMNIDERLKLFKRVLLDIEKLAYFHEKYPKIGILFGNLESLLEIYSPEYYLKKPGKIPGVEYQNMQTYVKIKIMEIEIQRLKDGIAIENINTGVYKIDMPPKPLSEEPMSEKEANYYLQKLEGYATLLWTTLVKLNAGVELNKPQKAEFLYEDEDTLKYIFTRKQKMPDRYLKYYNMIVTLEYARRKMRELFNMENVEKYIPDIPEASDFLDALWKNEEFVEMDHHGNKSVKIPLFLVDNEYDDEYSEYALSIIQRKRDTYAIESQAPMIFAIELQSPMFMYSDVHSSVKSAFLGKHGSFGDYLTYKYDAATEGMSIVIPTQSTLTQSRTWRRILYVVMKAKKLRNEHLIVLPVDHSNRLYGRIGVDVIHKESAWLFDLFSKISNSTNNAPEDLNGFYHTTSLSFLPVIQLDVQSERPEPFSERVYFNTCWMKYPSVIRMLEILKVGDPDFEKIAYVDLDLFGTEDSQKKELEKVLNDPIITTLIIHSDGHAKVCAKSIGTSLFFMDPFRQYLDSNLSLTIRELGWDANFVTRQKDQPHEASCHLISLMRAIMCVKLGWEKGFLTTYDFGRNREFLDYPVLVAHLVFWVVYYRPNPLPIR